MHRLFTLLLLLGVLAGLFSGRFVHAAPAESGHCTSDHAELVEFTIAHHHHLLTGDQGAHSGDNDCSESKGGQCHQHACQHSIPPAVAFAKTAFSSHSRLLGSVPAAPVSSIDEPVYELDTPPLI